MSDLTDKAYWDRVWEGAAAPARLNPDGGIWMHPARKLDALLHRAFQGLRADGRRLVELGCARSVWLPHLAARHGFQVCGIDYSELGCEQARALLAREGVRATIHCADFRAPPPELLGAMDAVVSFGLLEHFEDTAGAVAEAARFLRPGGVVFTEIPNMVGWLGRLQRAVDPSLYEAHVPMSREQLADAHRRAGLDVFLSEYVVVGLPTMLNTEGMADGLPRRVTRASVQLAAYVNTAVWLFDERVRRLPPPAFLAAYVVCAARRP